MKTFIFCLVIIALIISGVVWNAVYIGGIVSDMLVLTKTLPKSVSELDCRRSETEKTVAKLWEIWDASVDRIAVTVGYESINRADDAAIELFNSLSCDDGLFPVARAKLEDCLTRMKELESFSFKSIF